MSAVLVAAVAAAGSVALLGRPRVLLPGLSSRAVALAGMVGVVGAIGAIGAGAAGLVVPLTWLLPGALIGVAGVLVLALRARALRRRQIARTASQVLDLCDELVADLGAGVAPGVALDAVAQRWPELAPAASAQRLGGSVPDALRTLSAPPGASDLFLLGAAWEVAERSGSALAAAVTSVAHAAREQQRTRRLVRSELASARSTARLLAALPVFTLLMGSGAGGSPIGFLLGTPVGLGCLAGGLVLQGLGLLWIERIATGIEREA